MDSVHKLYIAVLQAPLTCGDLAARKLQDKSTVLVSLKPAIIPYQKYEYLRFAPLLALRVTCKLKMKLRYTCAATLPSKPLRLY